MLDAETKRRIDTARDILVGKVPDPKSQVEQITIALIYKFMDDMDAEAEELGGNRAFFSGEFAKYSWAKLLAPGLGGFEMLALYGEAITKMTENDGLPPLFRDIFKNAYLPYRDPETLKSFLKIINDFTYDHSERLGDAFEYLLSVLGSQGDAGQFRTPRHIIDFMVALLNPQKTDTILDPACGTAGFLISAYKHIMQANSKAGRPGAALNPQERARLLNNISGYDISPDMVRLSLVNLYLHGFTNPRVTEYDTLTSQDNWLHYADIILANPPFMSPKGGIRPHNRFSVKSSRSEVLFVDYMAEHLTPAGRAAIIVPEGIIFQSQNAYKQLRKMLVDEYLAGVISLPAGVFQPYSGVKTSILWLDKRLAKKTNRVLFARIEADGFDLGAQRRESKQNDLPAALEALTNYQLKIMNDEPFNPEAWPAVTLVDRADIAANGEYNLSGERYKIAITNHTHFPMVPLGDVAELLRGITFRKSDQLEHATEDSLLVATTKASQESGIVEDDLYHIPQTLLKDEKKLLRSGDILISTANSLNLLGRTTHVRKVERPMSFGAFMSVIRPKSNILDGYLIYCLRTTYAVDFFLRNANTTTNISNLNLSALAELQIPLPPLEVQAEIVAEIEAYQRIIDGARQVLTAYRPRITINPDWPVVALGDVFVKVGDSVYPPDMDEKKTNYIGLENIGQGNAELVGNIESNPKEIKSTKTKFQISDILYGKLRPNLNKVLYAEISGICSTDIFVLRADRNQVIPKLYSHYFLSNQFNQKVLMGLKGAQLPRVGYEHFSMIKIPLPDLATQEAIVAEIEQEQALVAANRQLIDLFEAKIKQRIARIWN